MRGYNVAWGDDTMPGRGVVSFDTETYDIEIVGFMNNRQRIERLQGELAQQEQLRDKIRTDAKKLTQVINHTKSLITKHRKL